jgi:hypothetical protein
LADTIPPAWPLGNDAATAQPSCTMTLRRRNLLNCICGSYANDGSKLQNIKLVELVSGMADYAI